MKYLLIIFLFSISASKTMEYFCVYQLPDPNYSTLSFSIGINKTNIKHNVDYLSSNSNFGLNLGIKYNIRLGSSLYSNYIILQSAYVSNGIDYNIINLEKDINDLKITEKNKHLQLSVNYLYKFLNTGSLNLHTLIGPYFNYILDDISSNNSIMFNNKSFNKYEIGTTLGIGFDYYFYNYILGIEYNYNYAFTDKYKYSDNYIKNKSHFINLIFSPRIRYYED